MSISTFAAKSYRDKAIVIRTHKLGEADRIITLLTRNNGLVRAVAKGVRRTKSKFGARLEPFMVIDVLLIKGRNLDIISQADSLGAYTQLFASDYVLYTIATAMLETAERLTQDSIDTWQEYDLLVGAINALNNQTDDPRLILDAYLLRAISHAGWTPSFIDCAKCDEAGPHESLSIPLGGALCDECRVPGAMAPAKESFLVLDGLLNSKWQVVRASRQITRNEVHNIVTTYVQYHLEKTMKSIKYVELQ
ncbi:MAG: DNA repair protein RecO [Micrococcaceae bacterium]